MPLEEDAYFSLRSLAYLLSQSDGLWGENPLLGCGLTFTLTLTLVFWFCEVLKSNKLFDYNF